MVKWKILQTCSGQADFFSVVRGTPKHNKNPKKLVAPHRAWPVAPLGRLGRWKQLYYNESEKMAILGLPQNFLGKIMKLDRFIGISIP